MNGIRAQKAKLRAHILRSRDELSADQREAAAVALMERVRRIPECPDEGTVAAYVSMGTEPGTGPLIEVMRNTGTRVLLPVMLPDNDLDWAEYRGPDDLVRTERGLFEPTGPRLGPDAVARVQLVLLPGLAVDTHGVRLGRGGGSYDRALDRVRQADTRPPLVVLLYAHEVVAAVPSEPHDHLVDAALTPQGMRRFRT